jgi:GntR family transcriptional regulator/MocR family aminotransferase
MEEPGNTAMRELLRQTGATVVYQPVDEQGIVVDQNLGRCDLVYVTPSHQIPTAVLMSPRRREALLAAAQSHDFLVIEDDYECEVNYLDKPQPALRSMDESGRVIYVASLSKVLAPGLRLGFIVANSEFIRRARALRRTMLNHPPLNNQRAASFFLSLGHYDALMMRLGRVLQERRSALHDALNWMRGVPMEISPEVGGTTYWVRTPDNFDVEAFAHAAAQRRTGERLLRERGQCRELFSNGRDEPRCGSNPTGRYAARRGDTFAGKGTGRAPDDNDG